MELDLNQILFFLTSIILIFTAAYIVKTASRKPPNTYNNRREQPYHVNPQQPYSPSYSHGVQQPYQVIQPRSIPANIETILRTHTPRTITLEIEFPELPPKLTIPFEKLPKLLEVIKEEEKTASSLASMEVGGEPPHHKKQERGEKHSVSFGKHPDNPLLDILSRVSGLEFSGDGNRVYCPRHGWTDYIITTDGRIMCREGYHILWDPNRERYMPPSKKELQQLQDELTRLTHEVEELQRQAEMRTEPMPAPTTPTPKKKAIEEEEEEIEEDLEE